MSDKWITRALARMKHLGLQDADVNRAMKDGGKGTFISDLRSGKSHNPRIDNFAKLARILRISVGGLYDGEKSAPATLFVEGVLKGKDMWQVLARNQKRERELSFFDADLAVIEVGTTELQPHYRLGDILAGPKTLGRNVDNIIGQDCIIETTTGERYVKYLARGVTHGTFSLRSLDRSVADIEDVKIAWAAPIQMVVRGIE